MTAMKVVPVEYGRVGMSFIPSPDTPQKRGALPTVTVVFGVEDWAARDNFANALVAGELLAEPAALLSAVEPAPDGLVEPVACPVCGNRTRHLSGCTGAALTSRAAVLEEGCTPVDIRVLREANVDLATENQKLRQALRFYANGDHWICEGKARLVWDTCSGEPQNWFWRENENDDAEGIEDGQIAKMALGGDSIDWEGEEPDAVEGEAEYAIRAAKGE